MLLLCGCVPPLRVCPSRRFSARRDVNDARHKRKQRTKDKHKMGDFIEENIQLREELNRITASAEVYATTLEKMEKQQEKLVAINEELQKELEEAKDDIERLKEEEEEASKALEEEEEESAALEAKIAELERELSLARQDKEEAVREVQAEVAKRDATISEMQVRGVRVVTLRSSHALGSLPMLCCAVQLGAGQRGAVARQHSPA